MNERDQIRFWFIFSRSSTAGLHLPFWLSAAVRDRRTPAASLCWCPGSSSSSGSHWSAAAPSCRRETAVVAARAEAGAEAPRRNSGQICPFASKLRVSVRRKPPGPSTARTSDGSQWVCCTSLSPDLFCAPSHRLFPRCSGSVDQTTRLRRRPWLAPSPSLVVDPPRRTHPHCTTSLLPRLLTSSALTSVVVIYWQQLLRRC